MAISLNRMMFKHINKQALIATILIGQEKGHAPDYA
jgi:hypothetical protein